MQPGSNEACEERSGFFGLCNMKHYIMNNKAQALYWLIFYGVLFVSLFVYLDNTLCGYIAAGRDDTFISLWAGKALSEGHGIVNYNYEPVEMSSSLLHTIIIAFINFVWPDKLFLMNKIMGILAGLMIFLVIYFKRSILFQGHISRLAAFAMVLLSLAIYPAFLYWISGGLETPFQTLLLFLYGIYILEAWQNSKSIAPLIVIQILYLLVRPEGFSLILFTSVFVVLRHWFDTGFSRNQIRKLIGIPLSVFSLLSIVRFLKFGLFFPSPVYAKTGIESMFGSIGLFKGMNYLKLYYSSSPYVLVQGILLIIICLYCVIEPSVRALTKKPAKLNPFIFWIGLIFMNHLFILLVGGDWMEYYRFIVPVIPLSTVLVIIFPVGWIASLRGRYSGNSVFYATSVSMIAMFAILMVLLPSQKFGLEPDITFEEQMIASIEESKSLLSILKEDIILRNCFHKRDHDNLMEFIDKEMPELYERLGRRMVIVTYQMGYVPYQIKQKHPDYNIKFVDTLGLGDSEITRLSLEKNSQGLVAGTQIDKILNGQIAGLSEYVLKKKPNMIYMMRASEETRQILEKLGWRIVWEKTFAIVFIKDQPA
jgi:hypothetical protein